MLSWTKLGVSVLSALCLGAGACIFDNSGSPLSAEDSGPAERDADSVDSNRTDATFSTGGTDAAPNGPDAAPDAAVPDAAVPDAAVPDAAPPDAAAPDAASDDGGS